MNPLKKGPEIKLPALKAPPFLVDVYYDLKDRHLLPLAALLVVALVAMPFLLSSSSDPTPEGSPAGGGASASTSNAGFDRSGTVVAQATPGLRTYQRRLDELESKNPFEQQYAEVDPSAAQASESSAGGSSGSVEYAETEYSEGGGSSGGGGPTYEGDEPSSTSSGELTYFSYAIDVRVVTGGSSESGADDGDREATVRRNLPTLTMLPSRKTPAIVYMGSTKDGKKAVMTVSSDVQAIFGDAKCVLGSQTCQMLVVEEGLPETFVYGGAGKTYTIEVLEIKLVESNKLNKAPLGDPKKGKGKGGNRPALYGFAQSK